MLLLSTNLALFGNVGYKNECTWTYFMDATSHAEASCEIYERILDTYGLTYQYISEFTKRKLLEKASKEQTLLQVFVHILIVLMKSRTWHGYVVFLHMKKQSTCILQGIPKRSEQSIQKSSASFRKVKQNLSGSTRKASYL